MCKNCGDSSHLDSTPTRRDFVRQATALGVATMLTPAVAGASPAPNTGQIPAVGYGKSDPAAPLAPARFTRDALKADEILVDVLYCGICHTDIHFSEQPLDYLYVPGHEIVGRVSRVGVSVNRFRVGDKVGIGPVVDSCGVCKNCRAGLEQYCTAPGGAVFPVGPDVTGKIRYGGYSNNIVVKQNFAVRIPDRMNLAAAPPMLCAGATTWSAIKAWKPGRRDKIGIIGMGGLGHLGIKFLADAGADITLFTTTPAKAADARRFGVKEVVTVGDTDAYTRLANQFDLIICTLPVPWDTGPYVSLLALDGTLLDLGLEPAEPPPPFMLAIRRGRLASSIAASIAETQGMLDYCASKGIAPEVEVIPITQVNAAWDRLRAKDVRYRFVIDMSSLHA